MTSIEFKDFQGFLGIQNLKSLLFDIELLMKNSAWCQRKLQELFDGIMETERYKDPI